VKLVPSTRQIVGKTPGQSLSREVQGFELGEERRCLQEFYGEVKEQDRHNEVNRILGAFKLNPFEQLGIKFDTTREDIRKHYRKVSLLVHPDKCSHPRAGDAFDILGQAQATLVQDDRFKELQYTVNMARGTGSIPEASTKPAPHCYSPLLICKCKVRPNRKKSEIWLHAE